MSFRKFWETRLLSAALAATLTLSAVGTATASNLSDAAYATDIQASPETDAGSTAEPATSVPNRASPLSVAPVGEPQETPYSAPTQTATPTPTQTPTAYLPSSSAEGTTISEPMGSVQAARSGSEGTASRQTFRPSDLSNWVVYDHYYNPGLEWSKNGAPAWDAYAGGGYHPFFYWKENNTSANDAFYNLSTQEGRSRLQTEVLGASAPRENGSACVANFSQHIYTEETASGSAIRFLGYGETFKTDWAIAPETARGLKSLTFDIDASHITSHSLESFGIFVNAGIDHTTDVLRGYAVNFKTVSGSRGTVNGSLQVVDLTNGVNASKLHDGLPGYERLAGLGPSASLTTFDFQNSAVGKVRVDLDVEPTKLTVKLAYYMSATQLSVPSVFVINLKDTSYSGYGPFANYNGENHVCARLSSVAFTCTVMSTNYSVLFDGNGATVNAKPTRIDGIVPGKSLTDMGMSLPTQPARLGYRFAGWNTAPDGSGQTFDASTPINKNATVYAIWTDQITITFVSDGGGSLSGNRTIAMRPGQSPTDLPTPQPNAGYRFSHWYVANDPNKTPYTTAAIERGTINGNVEFHAVFVETGKQYAVQYVAGANGTLQGSASYRNITAGEKLAQSAPAPKPVPNAGYVFAEWQDTRGARINMASAVVNEQTTRITARFERDENGDGVADSLQNRYTLTFSPSTGGKLQGQLTYVLIGGRKGDNKPLTINNVVGGKLVLPKAVPNTGYTFAGWTPAVNFLKMQLRGDARFVANFAETTSKSATTPSPFTIRFTSNNKVLKDYTATKGARVSDVTNGINSLPTPTAPSGYRFIGWTCPDGKIRTTAQVLLLYSDRDMTFVATFAMAKPK